jgi:Spy/CpxP family protein refolding chaperone
MSLGNSYRNVKISLYCALIAVVWSGGVGSLEAQTNDSQPPKLSAADQEKRTEEKHAKPILDALKLTDAAKEARVREIAEAQIKALNDWHAQNDEQIKSLWNEFNRARGKQDETNANLALGKIDAVYTTFKPQHEKFESELSSVLTPEQVETVKDALTINKVKITFNAYGEIFHGLTEEQKAFILKNLKAAREEAIDAGPMTEKSNFFKKYKIKIEAYLTAQGYDVKQSYREFVAKQKADEAAKKAAKTPQAADQK